MNDESSERSIVGVRWRLVSIVSAGNEQLIPESVGAGARFSEDGSAQFNDGVNVINATYSCVGEVLGIRGLSTTLAHYGGDNTAKLAAVAAFTGLVPLDGTASVVAWTTNAPKGLHLSVGGLALSLLPIA